MLISSEYWNARQTEQTEPEGFGFEIELVLPFASEMKCLENKSPFGCAMHTLYTWRIRLGKKQIHIKIIQLPAQGLLSTFCLNVYRKKKNEKKEQQQLEWNIRKA